MKLKDLFESSIRMNSAKDLAQQLEQYGFDLDGWQEATEDMDGAVHINDEVYVRVAHGFVQPVRQENGRTVDYYDQPDNLDDLVIEIRQALKDAGYSEEDLQSIEDPSNTGPMTHPYEDEPVPDEQRFGTEKHREETLKSYRQAKRAAGENPVV